MPCINRKDLWQTLLENQLLPELKNGPTAVMLSVNGAPCRVSLTYDHGLVIAESDSFTYTYPYQVDLKGD